VGRPTAGEGETVIVTQRVTDPYTAEHVLSVGNKLCLESGETYETASEGAPHTYQEVVQDHVACKATR
jgi:hypothetical protein